MMSLHKISGAIICTILALATSHVFAIDQADPAAFQLVSSEAEDSSSSLAGTSFAQSDGSGSCNIGGCGSGCGQSAYCPRWTASADFIILDRNGTKSQELVRSIYSRNTDLLNSNDFSQGFYGGPRVGLIRHGDCCYDIELLYFQIDGWDSTRSVTPDADVIEFSVPGYAIFSTSDTMQFNYSSKLYNAEMNVRWNPTCRVTMLAGFRWAELREDLDGGLALATYESFWNTHTKNNLFGFQIGTDTKLWEYGCFSIDGIAKAGVYCNNAEQRSTYRYSADFGSAAASTNHTAFLGEVGLQCKYQVTCYLTLRAGYEAMWLDGVALAPGQIPQTNLSQNLAGIDANGSVFYHGATAGLEYKF
jgi:hypothetical protein